MPPVLPFPAAIRIAFPQLELVVFNGSSASLQDTISLFQRARVVLGPHGAGLSHILFSAPGTTGELGGGGTRPPARCCAPSAEVQHCYAAAAAGVAHLATLAHSPLPLRLPVIEFHFLADPPLMFWHAAAALGQPYWLLPVPQAYWMQEEMQVRRAARQQLDLAAVGFSSSATSLCHTKSCMRVVLEGCLGRAAYSRYFCCCLCLRCLLHCALNCTAVLLLCLQVPAGEVVDILTAVLRDPTVSASCLPGTYASVEDGTVRCTACSAGSYAFNPSATACKPCPAGRVAPHLGSTACRTCQPGTYSSADGKACVACPAGGA